MIRLDLAEYSVRELAEAQNQPIGHAKAGLGKRASADDEHEGRQEEAHPTLCLRL